ncbi:DUF4129 domain-containing protein [Aquimonas sp.]|jgi:hypothetical protein|uniref:DUF4129 domain-containing protein n=1 Tax=Aquimonas sp. TaxID=1872588 RepID=UPI0037BE3F59
MRIEDLSVALRPRSGWEAVELGFALTRRHAGVVFAGWLLLSLPVLAVLTAICWPLDLLWLPPLLMWWLKPAFERLPLHVYSRAVFGQAPQLGEALRAQRGYSWGSLLPWLLWRRLSPTRSLLVPVDFLEGAQGPLRRARRQALARNASGNAILLMLACLHFEAILAFGAVALLILMVPIEFMGDAAKAIGDTLFIEPPQWAQATLNLLYWLSVSLIAPFYVGGGFGLYLNRRTQIEAWDIELGFRRMTRRLATVSAVLLAPLLALALTSAPTQAQAAAAEVATEARADDSADDSADEDFAEEPCYCGDDCDAGDSDDCYDEDEEPRIDHPGPTSGEGAVPSSKDVFKRVFAHTHIDGGAEFIAHSDEVYSRENLSPVKTQSTWVPRKPPTPDEIRRGDTGPAWLRDLASLMSLLVENILWLLLAALVLLILLTLPRWMPLLDAHTPLGRRRQSRLEAGAVAPTVLPDDIPAAVRRLWNSGQPRAALALLYAAGVQRVVERTGEPLPPGSTEADCLRRGRRLGNSGFGALFPRIVRSWQAAAYADRLPGQAELEALLQAWSEPATPASAEPAA